MQIELTDSLWQEAMYIKNDTLQRKGDTLDNKVFSYKHVLTVISIWYTVALTTSSSKLRQIDSGRSFMDARMIFRR